ncbi:PRC-barrel domain-containing protein [Microvirga tunisiensis]|uniref:PRC-barrel domain containing protein n=1 Tax=Microvirga tunisiensis TaxID=2108360 RepID=A0A5N7MH14_9HYPH|nr:PRC-barrel domain-containing protein [Microvirga tunisiensis]MPR08004.1 PRC-barrel domain containing protein [Microvirga tunisiensis]MPR26315.1 PRC-barrel domain containing protein [Microvirga tunisiensis]
MLKKHMAACLVVTAFAAAPALAQTSSPSAPTDRPAASGSGTTTTGSPAMQPGASGSSTAGQSSASMGQSSATSGQFMTKMEMNQIMASDLIGTRVVSANNESIGDINDVIVDRNGQVMAAVVGVGGFLGIGEKDVAVPFKSLEFMSSQQAQAMDNSKSGNNNVNTTGSTATTGNTATSGSGSAGSTNTAANTSSSNQNQPERVMLRMTKAELQAAPAFDEDGDNNANNSTTGTTGATTAPKQ